MSKRAHLLVGILVLALAVLVAGCAESPAGQAEKRADAGVANTNTDEQSSSETATSKSETSQEDVSVNDTVPAANTNKSAESSDPLDDSAESDVIEDIKNQVISLVEEFGKKLQSVSLLVSQDVLKKSLQENYGDLVIPDLIEQWLADPADAPGRVTSSPWPERIEINSITKVSDSTYEVEGEIIEITSTEVESNKAAAKRPIILTVTKSQDRWLISSVSVGDYEGDYENEEQITYRNDTYGFSFLLPASWQGYEIIEGEWEGYSIGDSSNTGIPQTGPKISIRHPLWTEDEPRQDIPIMVLTTEQWEAIERDEFHIGAAPIGPRKIGQNARYVFAIPARYNFAFLTGFEEVEEILANDPLIVEE